MVFSIEEMLINYYYFIMTAVINIKMAQKSKNVT